METWNHNPDDKSCPAKSGKRGFSLPFVTSVLPMPHTEPPRKETDAHTAEKSQADIPEEKNNHVQEKKGTRHV